MKIFSILFLILFGLSSQAQIKQWTLPECVAYALENNITIKQSELDVKETSINKKDVIGNFLPTVNGSASHSWSKGLSQDPVTFDAVSATTKTLSGGISSNISIFNGLRNLNQLHRSNLQILASKYQLDDIKDDISLFVANSFLQILFNKEQLKVLQSQQEVSNQELKRTSDLVEAGALPKGDILEIQATLASQEQQIVNTENSILISKINLAQIMLIADYENFDIVDVDYEVPPTSILNESPQTIFYKAQESRNEIKIAETNLEIAKDNLKIFRGGLLPSLSGFYSFNTNYFTSELFDTPSFTSQISDNKRHNFGLQLNIPMLNGFAQKNNVGRNKINVERSKNQLEQVRLNLETKVYQSYNDTKGALKAYEAALKTLEARNEAFKYSQERYNVGLLNAFDFSQSQNRLEVAQSEVIRTKYDYIFKLKVLEYYFGVPITTLN